MRKLYVGLLCCLTSILYGMEQTIFQLQIVTPRDINSLEELEQAIEQKIISTDDTISATVFVNYLEKQHICSSENSSFLLSSLKTRLKEKNDLARILNSCLIYAVTVNKRIDTYTDVIPHAEMLEWSVANTKLENVVRQCIQKKTEENAAERLSNAHYGIFVTAIVAFLLLMNDILLAVKLQG